MQPRELNRSFVHIERLVNMSKARSDNYFRFQYSHPPHEATKTRVCYTANSRRRFPYVAVTQIAASNHSERRRRWGLGNQFATIELYESCSRDVIRQSLISRSGGRAYYANSRESPRSSYSHVCRDTSRSRPGAAAPARPRQLCYTDVYHRLYSLHAYSLHDTRHITANTTK